MSVQLQYVLGSTKPLIEVSTSYLPGGKRRPVCLIAFGLLIVSSCRSLTSHKPVGLHGLLLGLDLPFRFYICKNYATLFTILSTLYPGFYILQYYAQYILWFFYHFLYELCLLHGEYICKFMLVSTLDQVMERN